MLSDLGIVPPTRWQPPTILRPPVVRTLGAVPRGFLESADCTDTSPAFVRGYLIGKAEYNALSQEQQLNISSYWQFPHWTLYGGLLGTRQDAEQWGLYMPFWAESQGLMWLDYGSACVAPATDGLKWPADHSFRWEWVYEASQPRKVTKVWNPNAGRYEWRWVT